MMIRVKEMEEAGCHVCHTDRIDDGRLTRKLQRFEESKVLLLFA